MTPATAPSRLQPRVNVVLWLRLVGPWIEKLKQQVHRCYVGDSPQPTTSPRRRLQGTFSLGGRRQDRRKRSKLYDGQQSSRGIRPSVPALGDGGELVLHDSWQVRVGGEDMRPLGIAIDWVVDRSSLISTRQCGRWLNVQSGHREDQPYRDGIRAMLRAKRNAEKAATVKRGARSTEMMHRAVMPQLGVGTGTVVRCRSPA